MQIKIGLLLAIPAALCLLWLFTDSRAGYFMILWVFIALGASALLAMAVSLILGGIWTVFDLPGRLVARLSPLLLLACGALYIFMS